MTDAAATHPTSSHTANARPTIKTVAEIRAHIPALERLHQRHAAVAYFAGPGGTQVPRRVVEAMNDYLYHHNANTHWSYPTSAETDAIIEDARRTLAEFLNAPPDEIVFGANMPTLTFHLSRALGRDLTAGDEIIVTELDHHANVAPWHALALERGASIRTVRMNPETGQLDWEDFNAQLAQRTRLVAIGARYADGRQYELDGLSVEYPDWHFNVRPSNTEPLLRLNLESLVSREDMERRRDEVLGLIRG